MVKTKYISKVTQESIGPKDGPNRRVIVARVWRDDQGRVCRKSRIYKLHRWAVVLCSLIIEHSFYENSRLELYIGNPIVPPYNANPR